MARGWESRDFPVTLWNSLVAALKIAVKLSVKVPVVSVLADIGSGAIKQGVSRRKSSRGLGGWWTQIEKKWVERGTKLRCSTGRHEVGLNTEQKSKASVCVRGAAHMAIGFRSGEEDEHLANEKQR